MRVKEKGRRRERRRGRERRKEEGEEERGGGEEKELGGRRKIVMGTQAEYPLGAGPWNVKALLHPPSHFLLTTIQLFNRLGN